MQKRLAADGVEVPVIFISAFCTDEVRKQAMEHGALSFLCKPVDSTEIQACLDKVARGD